MIARIGSAVHDRGTADARDAVVVARLQALAPGLDGEPDADFRTATRARLVAMAAVRSPAADPVSPVRRLVAGRSPDAVPARWGTRLTAGLAGAALTMTALATLVAVSTGARPGDVLYGLKRGTEQTQLALAGDSRRGQTLLDLASTRLDELEYLVSEDATALPVDGAPAGGTLVVLAAGPGAELVLQTLDTMDAQTTDGAAWLAQRSVTADDARPLDALAGWVAGQSAGLSALTGEMPEAARSAFDDSLQLLTEIGTRTDGLRTALACSAGPATAGSDELGPVPAACPPAPAAGGAMPGPTAGIGGGSGGTPPAGPTADVSGGTSSGTGSTGSGSTGSGSTGPGSTGSVSTGSGANGAPGGTGGSSGGAVPSGVPSLPVPGGGLPTPSLPSIDLPTTVVPPLPVPLPGSSPTAGPPSTGLDVDVCLGPITLGSC